MGLLRIIQDYARLYRTIKDFETLYRSADDATVTCTGINMTVQDFT